MPNEWTIPYTAGFGPKSAAFPDGYPAKRPYLKFFLVHGEQRTESEIGVADTGADFCAFPFRLLELLQIDANTLPTANSVGLGAAKVVFAPVQLHVPQLNFAREIYAHFSVSQDSDTHMLGHMGFLEHFVSVFDYQKGLFALIEPSVE